ncbi:MAG: V-type ATP synthase subunit E [Ruminococcus sp.]|nr:V-type ATP synthase subunit E [Ruminococcus sp.]
MPKNKTDNFLKAIKKYAEASKTAMQGEVKQLKTERLREAEKQAELDSGRLIQEKLQEKQNEQTAMLAKKTQEGQKKLFVERSAMVDEVFRLAFEKLTDYTKTGGYSSKLIESAKAVAEVFDGNDCVVYVGERDFGSADKIKALFGGKTEVKTDKTIKIGGVRGYCESMGIIADETLDSKLEAQREWFVENAALSVL